MKWFLKAMKQYADFKGRARRKEYWYFTLFNVLIAYAWMAIIGLTMGGVFSSGEMPSPGIMFLLYIPTLVMIIPGIAVGVRRLHDIGKSGWSYLIGLIPLAGGIILLIWFCKDGVPETNQWGSSPKYGTDGNEITDHLIEA